MLKRMAHLNRLDLPAWLVVIALLAVWQTVSRWQQSVFFPPPTVVLQTLVTDLLSVTMLTNHIVPSLVRVLGGFFGAAAVGVVLGVVIGYWRWVREALDPIMQFLRSVPAPVMIPMAILTLGLGNTSKVAVIVFGACWPILLNTIDGTRHVGAQLKDTARVFDRGPFEILYQVVFPAALPQIFAGLRISLPIALVLMVISEMVASTNGLGYSILRAQRTFRIPEMYAGIVLLGILGFLLNAAFVTVERRVLRWHVGYRK